MTNYSRKYLISVLTILLVLSNFAFAAHSSICVMSIPDENSECACSHDNDFSGLNISSFSECCIEKTIELNNSNSFIKDSKNNQYQLMNYTLISNDLLVKEFSEINVSSFNNIIPYKSDIPILISALLI